MKLAACVVMVGCVLSNSMAQAQTLPPGITGTIDPLQPKWEVGASIGGWLGPDGRGSRGIRTARNFNDWFGVEVAVSGRDSSPGHAMLECRARFVAPPIPGRVGQPFLTAGLVRAAGTSYKTSPMFGAGIQTRWQDSPISLRAELQVATRGEHVHHDRLRGLLGLSFAIKKD
jgi:hypothetical protein